MSYLYYLSIVIFQRLYKLFFFFLFYSYRVVESEDTADRDDGNNDIDCGKNGNGVSSSTAI
jgi:hypothetical protein